ncbi:MAG: DUF2851 family protein, partial [Dehalococcoidia bacterium]|nr:DUF2851 family protein [Dehalococcoidia bacterium]
TCDPADVEALFLGSAGLLPSQAENKCPHPMEESVTVLENSWASWKKRQLLQRRDWVFFKVRPANTPPRRIAAAAYLLIHRWLPDPVESLLPFLENKDHLAKILVAPAGDYWTDHMDFNVPAPYSRNLIGRDRAGETVVNVFLPFLYALGNVRRWHKLRSHAMDIYMSSPAMAEYGINQVMKNRLLDCLPGNTALQQQGLLHIYKNYCCSQRCATCPIARSRLLHHCENTPDEPC